MFNCRGIKIKQNPNARNLCKVYISTSSQVYFLPTNNLMESFEHASYDKSQGQVACRLLCKQRALCPRGVDSLQMQSQQLKSYSFKMWPLYILRIDTLI